MLDEPFYHIAAKIAMEAPDAFRSALLKRLALTCLASAEAQRDEAAAQFEHLGYVTPKVSAAAAESFNKIVAQRQISLLAAGNEA